MKLGKLEKADLKDCWKHEAIDFTPWLAQPENIEILSETVGLTLEVQGVEQNVGPFRADILCLDIDNFSDDSKHYVLIENQLEITDHKHLGQLMTYAAGLDVVTLIWIASKFTEEHRAALDWLNRITDDTFRFFGIEIELYRIGDSLPAPRFNIVAKPNNWSKDVKRKANSSIEVSESGLLRQEYWQEFKNFMEFNKSFLKVGKPSHRLYSNFSIGRAGFGLSASVRAKDKRIVTTLWLDGQNHKENFDKLRNVCLEKSFEQLGKDLVWNRNNENNSSTVFLTYNLDYTDRNSWESQFAWFKENLERFANFFKPEIAKI